MMSSLDLKVELTIEGDWFWLIDWLSKKGDICCYLFKLYNLIVDLQNVTYWYSLWVRGFYDLVFLEVYAGWFKGSSIYTQVGFIEVVYTFWHMIFEVEVGSGCWCSVLGSDLCTGYSDLSIQVD